MKKTEDKKAPDRTTQEDTTVTMAKMKNAVKTKGRVPLDPGPQMTPGNKRVAMKSRY